MINTRFLSPVNVLIIGVIAIATHVLAKPLYAAVDGK